MRHASCGARVAPPLAMAHHQTLGALFKFMQRSMSSATTVFPMIFLPLIMLSVLVGSVVSAFEQGNAIPVFAVLPFVVFSFWFSWRIHFVSTDGNRIYLWSYRGSKEALLSEIQSVRAFSRSKTPRIELTLKLSSGAISKISFLPPIGFTTDRFWDEYEFLSQYAENADHDVPQSSNPRESANSKNSVILIIWVLILVAILGLAFFTSK